MIFMKGGAPVKPLNVIVCVKPVPDSSSKIEFNKKTKTISRENVNTIINPLDKNALEVALQLKESFGGKVTALAMAPPFAETLLKEVLALGADEAFLLTDRAFAGSDTYATSYILAQGIKKIGGFDLIITGAASIDGNTAQVGPQLAEHLDLPHICFVTSISRAGEDCLELTSKLEEGSMTLEVKLPAVITVDREVNEPRQLNLFGLMAAAGKTLTVYNLADLGMEKARAGEEGSPTRIGDIFEVSMERKCEFLEDKPEDIDILVQKFREWGVI